MNKMHDLAGERKQQMLNVCNKSGIITGQATREACHQGSGITHLAFMAFIGDGKNNILLTRRSGRKSLWSQFWDASVVSHVLPGETVEEATARRSREELGIETEYKRLGAFYYYEKHGFSCENEYCYVLRGDYRESVYPNPVEIDGIRWMSITELRKDVVENSGQYTPWLKLALKQIQII